MAKEDRSLHRRNYWMKKATGQSKQLLDGFCATAEQCMGSYKVRESCRRTQLLEIRARCLTAKACGFLCDRDPLSA